MVWRTSHKCLLLLPIHLKITSERVPSCWSPRSSSPWLFKSGVPVYKNNVAIEFCAIEFHPISITSVFKVILFFLYNNLIMYWQCKWRSQKENVATEEVCAETSFSLSRLVFPGCLCSQGKERNLSRSLVGAKALLRGMNCAWWSSSILCHRKTPEKLVPLELSQSLWIPPTSL